LAIGFAPVLGVLGSVYLVVAHKDVARRPRSTSSDARGLRHGPESSPASRINPERPCFVPARRGRRVG